MLHAGIIFVLQTSKMNFAFKTIHQFNEFFHNEAVCYEFYEKVRWENGTPVCPHCGGVKYYKVKARGKFQDIPSYRCGHRECDLPFTVRTKSIFEGSKVELRKWFLAIYEISTCKKGISSVELANRVGVSQKTGWYINHRIREMLKETEPALLSDVVQLDETLIGGKNRFKHADKKIPNSQGRSSKGKTTLLAARGLLGEIRTQVIPNVEAETIKPMVDKWIQPGSMVITDEWRSYSSLKKDYFHITVNHSEGQYANGAFSSNGVENYFSILKRSIIGTFHVVSPQHLQKYSDECSFRYNRKNITNSQLFNLVIKNADLERTTYKELTNEWKDLFPKD